MRSPRGPAIPDLVKLLGPIFGVLLILGALVAGVAVLPEQVIGYVKDGQRIERELAEADAKLTAAKTAPDAEMSQLVEHANRDLDSVQRAKEFRGERLQGIAIVGGGGLLAIALGIWLIRRSRRTLTPTT